MRRSGTVRCGRHKKHETGQKNNKQTAHFLHTYPQQSAKNVSHLSLTLLRTADHNDAGWLFDVPGLYPDNRYE